MAETSGIAAIATTVVQGRWRQFHGRFYMDLEVEYDNWLSDQNRLTRKTQKCFVGCRGYGHFDSEIGIKRCIEDSRIREEICNPVLLGKHKFWPFIRQDKKTRRYTRDKTKELRVKNKLRPIMYASHRDAIIMAFYSWIMKRNYENCISKSIANESVIGYRRIPIGNGRNKSNIDFAKDVFDFLHTADDCVLLCVDIENFFGNIDHRLLADAVEYFRGDIPVKNLEPILKAVTQYRYVFKSDIVAKMGKDQSKWANSSRYNILIRDAGLIHKNKQWHGIPQGSPISDILANIYLYKFDLWLSEKVSAFGGLYRRYSDDILVIIPKPEAENIYKKICDYIEGDDFKLKIGKEKTEAFYVDARSLTFQDITSRYVSGYSKNKEHAQYLGFDINLQHMSVRPGTIAKHYRKETRRTKRKRKTTGKITKNKHTAVKTPMRKYQYLKTAANKTGDNTISRQLRKVRKRDQSMRYPKYSNS